MEKRYAEIELPGKDECSQIIGKALANPGGQPEDLPTLEHPGHHLGATRRVTYRGHEIEIKTTYEFKIDGKLFEGQVMVDAQGHPPAGAAPAPGPGFRGNRRGCRHRFPSCGSRVARRDTTTGHCPKPPTGHNRREDPAA